MNILEIKNNLVKLSYDKEDNPILGRFIVLVTSTVSYVAQFVNLKSDDTGNCAIAKLLFTFNSDGIVDNYDGSVPDINAQLSSLKSSELLDLLPIETPLKIGRLAQQSDILNLDISVFEGNYTIVSEKASRFFDISSNFVRQLFQMKEKSVIIDTYNVFDNYPKIALAEDFRLPLNAEMIDYIFDYELAEVELTTKAVIQDVFAEVRQYIKTLKGEFLPIDTFVDVISAQYKSLQMPELALLKNKLLKYQEARIFANSFEEFSNLKLKLNEKNCSVINIANIDGALQKEVIAYIHKTLEGFNRYIYLFVNLNDENSDKKLLKQILNHNHIFTTLFTNYDYKYLKELSINAKNMILCAPEEVPNGFSQFSTFLNKLGAEEGVAVGELTQNVPFIITTNTLDLDLTIEDVLGDKYRFVPAVGSEQFEMVEKGANQNLNNQPLNIHADNVPVDKTLSEPTEIETNYSVAIPQTETTLIANNYNINSVQDTSADEADTVNEVHLTDEISVKSELPEFPEITENNEESFNSLLQQEIVEDNTASDESDSFDSILDEESVITEKTDDDINDLFDDTESYVQESQEDISIDNLETEEVSMDFPQEDLSIINDEDINETTLDEFDTNAYYTEDQANDDLTDVVPVFPADADLPISDEECGFQQGDSVSHSRYGLGVVEKIIKYGNKTLCSISFENVGRRLLDPSISELTKV